MPLVRQVNVPPTKERFNHKTSTGMPGGECDRQDNSIEPRLKLADDLLFSPAGVTELWLLSMLSKLLWGVEKFAAEQDSQVPIEVKTARDWLGRI